MDRMLESLENLLDDVADPEYEVEYGVRQAVPVRYVLRQTLTPGFAERCPDTEARQQGDICHQQAAAKQTDLAVISVQVCPPTPRIGDALALMHSAADPRGTTTCQNRTNGSTPATGGP